MDRRKKSTLALILFSASASAWAALPPTAKQLEKLSSEITAAENDLLRGGAEQSALQIKRIRKLLVLQRKEISLSNQRVKELASRIESFAARKEQLDNDIAKKKSVLRKRLKALSLTAEKREAKEDQSLDASWVAGSEQGRSVELYAEKSIQKQKSALEQLGRDRNEVTELEARMIEEKAELEYFVQELKEKTDLLMANEQLQVMLLKSRKTEIQKGVSDFSKQVATMKTQREKERDVKRVISKAVPSGAEAIVSPLLQLKGTLPFPVPGEVVSHYGRFYDKQTSLLTFQKGISIQTFGGTDVKAVTAGRVVYAGLLKNYGTMVIVEHPGQFYTLYGQLGQAEVKEGGRVQAGDVVGRTASDGKPLYFELRNKNVAINPMPWLQKTTITLNGR